MNWYLIYDINFYDKMDKDLNYQNIEIALIKNSRGTVAASPEEALKNLWDTHFPTAIETTEGTIVEAHKLYSNKTLIKWTMSGSPLRGSS